MPDPARAPLIQLAWPLLVENVLRVSLMSIDTLMLSHYSPEAVAAMSVATQFGFVIQLLYMLVSIGASVLITQHLGAGERARAGLYGVGSLNLIVALAVVISVLVAVGGGAVIGIYGLEPRVARYATQFITLYGGLSVFMAINIAQASILRSWGHVRDPMVVNTLCLVLTAAGNALCLFGPFGFPVLGVTGVAASTVASQAVACVLSGWMIARRRDVQLPLRELGRIPREMYRKILALGIPTAGESLSYSLSQIAILGLLSGMGTTTLASYGILLAVLRYVFMPGVSIGAAGQLLVGYLVGSGRHDDAARRIYRYAALGMALALGLVVLLKLFQRPVLALFSDDPHVVGLVASVLAVSLIFEPGRSLNVIVIPALKGAGDVRFPVLVGIASMWTLGVFGGWLLGVHFGLGLVGVWIAMASDEWLRGLTMLWRWRSGAWRSRSLVTRGGAGTAAAVAGIDLEEGL